MVNVQSPITPPDPTMFPPPNLWATWIPERSPSFKTHTRLGQAKNAITGRGRHQERIIGGKSIYHTRLREAWVFEFVGTVAEGTWVERYHIPNDAWKEDHPLWQKPARPVSAKVLEKTFASIAKASHVPTDTDLRRRDT